MSTPTTALFAVIDGNDPVGSWTPWGVAAPAVKQITDRIVTPRVPQATQLSYAFHLILVPPQELLARATLAGVTGALIDLMGKESNRQVHEDMCYRIAGATDPLIAKTGYHLGFVLSGTPSNGQLTAMDQFYADASHILGGKAATVSVGAEIGAFSVLEPVLRNFERHMRALALKAR